MQERRKRDASLDNILTGLLRLHKALLDDEGVAYERVHGRISSNGAFLRLTLNDAWFAWLGPHSQSIVKLDELSESDDAGSGETIPALLESVQPLLVPMENGEDSVASIMRINSEALTLYWRMPELKPY